MEIASTAVGIVGLAALFDTCIETLDTISSAARYGVNRQILQTKIEVERVRLMVWGDAVGITEISVERGEQEITEDELAVLDESLRGNTLRPAVAGLLACFVRYFEDLELLQKRYGLAPAQASIDTGSVVKTTPTREMLLATFQKTYSRFHERHVQSQQGTSSLKKARWAVTDEKKFRALLGELKAINDSLASLLPAIRDKGRVQLRAEIMRSSDLEQLETLVAAADDATDLIAETASLRLEMLSTASGAATSKVFPRAVQVKPAQSSGPERPVPTAASSQSVVQALIAATLDDPSSPAPTAPPTEPYDNAGALVIQKLYSKPDTLACYHWLVGLGEEIEQSKAQPIHPAFALQFTPESVSAIAEPFLELEINTDAKYTGWSPGSTSLAGFAREITLWKKIAKPASSDKPPPTWHAAQSKSLTSDAIDSQWNQIREGLGEDFTDRKGFDTVRELIGPSNFAWLDPGEEVKLRHQITDLLGALSISPVPSVEHRRSIFLLACNKKIDPTRSFSFIDFMRKLLLAREALLRIRRDNSCWYGGITCSQLDGIILFVDQMQWPFATEVHAEVARARESLGAQNPSVEVSLVDWVAGLVLPGTTFPVSILTALYGLSPTLRTRLPRQTVQARQGNYGIVYPQASYWHYRSVVGKVLAPLSLLSDSNRGHVKCLGGWVGPCLSPALPECTYGLLIAISAHPPPYADTEGGDKGGHDHNPLVTTDSSTGWTLPSPPPAISQASDTDAVTLQTVRLSKAPAASTKVDDAQPYTVRLDFRLHRPRTFSTFTLYTNSVFVAAPPCRGTHRVDPDRGSQYTFRICSIESLAQVPRRGGASGGTAILVIDAAGGAQSEVFARAWCCHTGTNAVVWKNREGEGGCCFKCALMAASAEGLGTGVVIAC
ncbi:prion-inhibition and propagation-domain-containing protein [Aspergillus lucknowensis]|uniref:Prion-inhibition and propagation-domain-containing protein n=1 Tax=Aspergillus lucknowensis TaxID=176173 RepID=A0ABR4LP91_9EURO